MLEVIILAAGHGSRMQSSLPKVLHTLAGQPLVEPCLETRAEVGPSASTLVVGTAPRRLRRL